MPDIFIETEITIPAVAEKVVTEQTRHFYLYTDGRVTVPAAGNQVVGSVTPEQLKAFLAQVIWSTGKAKIVEVKETITEEIIKE